MRFLFGVLAGIVLTAVVPAVGDFTRDSLNTVFSQAQRATAPSVEDEFNKMVDKLTR